MLVAGGYTNTHPPDFGVTNTAELYDPGSGTWSPTAVSIVRPGGAVGRVGVPQENAIPNAQETFFANIIIAGGPARVRA